MVSAASAPPAGLPSFPFPPDLLGILVQGKAVAYTNVAFLMLLVYDHLLTFGTEVATVWTLPWGLPKAMFMINRYVVPPMLFFNGISEFSSQMGGLTLKDVVSAITEAGQRNVRQITGSHFEAYLTDIFRCEFITHWTAWPTLVSLSAVDIILLLRVKAIYGNKKEVVWGLYSFYVLTLIPFIVLAIMTSIKTTALPSKGTPFTDCLFSAPSFYYAAWIPPTVFESVLIFLTLLRTVRFGKVNPTLRVLARDSIVYFLIIFALLLANTFIARFGKGFIGAALIVPCSVTACIAAARMMMNIRMMVPEIAHAQGQELTQISTKNIQFNQDRSLVDSSDTQTVVQHSENAA